MGKNRAKGGKGSLSARPSAAGPRPASPFKPMTLVLFAFVFLVLFSKGLRDGMGAAAGFVLGPSIGFAGHYPALTILLASVITGVATGVIRHLMVDWVKVARTQETMRAFQRELRQARKDSNTYKVKRMTELQPELMKLQADLSGAQFKPMAFTMVIVVPMFAWLWSFIQGLGADPTIAAPWGLTKLTTPARVLSFFPTWILIYSLFSIPIGQLVQKGLKAYSFSRKLRLGAAQEGGA